MKNTINYYYNLNPNKINQIFHYYYFYVNNELYYFMLYTKNPKEIRSIYEFNQVLLQKNILVHEIVNNRTNTILTYVNQIPYLLMKISININKPITLPEICYLSSILIPYPRELMRSNWMNLWTNKIDYLEYHHEQNYQKYPLLSASFNYFIGMSENAISYLNRTISNLKPEKSDIGVVSHDIITLDDTVYALYDPQNIIIDHKARDLAEYIKISFFRDNYSIFDELDEYFKHNYFSFYGIQLLMARVLWPSFYFELYDDILESKINESSILKITSRIAEYEKYLGDVFRYFHKYYNIEDVGWLKKDGH
ncbi:MAG: hypothetical protein MR598_06305 [Erysipelotrichaceae bacterium]|nr:hypothetical protein [Erysipelotrichaceae bacterium]